MSEPDEQERAKDLARLWQGTIAPMEDEGVMVARRERVVPTLGLIIERTAARQRKAQTFRRVATGLSVAATVLLAIGLGRYAHTAHVERPSAAVAVAAPLGGVRATSGVVTLLRGTAPQLVDQSALEMGDTLATTASATAELRLTNLVVAELGSESEVSVVAPRASTHRLRLDRGRIDAHVDDHPSPTPKLVVETPNVEIVVTGTVFQVDVTSARSQDAVTVVSVTKGRIVVRRDGRDVAAVTAGQRWSSETPRSGEATEAAQAVAAPAVAPAAPQERHAVAAAPSAVPAPPVPAAPEWNGTLSEENRLFQAAAEARNRGSDYEAIRQLTELLSRYPGSPLAGEARVERMRALRRTGHVLEAAREASRYLSDYPNGFAREEARGLVMQDEVH